jgi:hypothetical protein
LRDLGFGLGFVHEATTHEVIYQAVMRTSLRHPNATNSVIIIVPDRVAAYRLKDLIGAISVTKLGNIESPKPRPLTPAERNRPEGHETYPGPVCGENITKLEQIAK